MQTQYINALEIIEQHSGIDKSAAEAIALHYRQLGGYTIQLVEDKFRCDITVHRIPSENTTFQAKEVKS